MAALCAAKPLLAQSKPVTFYYQNVPLWSQETELIEGNVSDFNRFRVMSDPAWGDFSFRFAYEKSPHALLGEKQVRGVLDDWDDDKGYWGSAAGHWASLLDHS